MTATVPAATTSATASATTRVPGRRVHRAVWALQILLALFFAVASAGPKLVGHASAAESFDRIGFGDWFMYLTGSLELAGAIALVVPVLSGLSALALIGLMGGALITQLTVFDGQNALTPVVFAVLLAVVARVRRDRTARLFALVRERF
ncbi:DoxX family protein [Streptomyces sp. NPDC089919]|uniref:DoxX family protein n=1 Tax=Streptomyces sp. NPDC089919 TaxID=3155188 RepID=UPI003444560F